MRTQENHPGRSLVRIDVRGSAAAQDFARHVGDAMQSRATRTPLEKALAYPCKSMESRAIRGGVRVEFLVKMWRDDPQSGLWEAAGLVRQFMLQARRLGGEVGWRPVPIAHRWTKQELELESEPRPTPRRRRAP